MNTASLFSDLLQPGAKIRPHSPTIRPAERRASQGISPNSPLSPVQNRESRPDPIAEAAHAHGLTADQLRKDLTADDIQAIEDDLPGERKALWTFAGIVAQQIIQERHESFEERAAILEFDANMPRDQAEQEAARMVYCRACAHFTPDSLNPDMGLGACAVRPAGTLLLPYPGATCRKNQLKEL